MIPLTALTRSRSAQPSPQPLGGAAGLAFWPVAAFFVAACLVVVALRTALRTAGAVCFLAGVRGSGGGGLLAVMAGTTVCRYCGVPEMVPEAVRTAENSPSGPVSSTGLPPA
jgi:hypothetical protein